MQAVPQPVEPPYLPPDTDPLAPLPQLDNTSLLLNSIRDELQNGPGGFESLWLILGIAALLGLLLLLARLTHPPANNPARRGLQFFRAAVKAAGVGDDVRRDLEQLAKRSEIDPPTAILLSPRCFARAIALLPPKTPHALRARLQTAGETLFGAPLPPPFDPPPGADNRAAHNAAARDATAEQELERSADPLLGLRADADDLI